MKVILTQDVEDVGKKMQVVTVKDGYGQNFLIKKKLAVLATDENMKKLQQELARIAAEEAEMHKNAQDICEKIDGNRFDLPVRGGSSGKLYGSVTNQEVADCIKKASGIEVDKKKITFETIKTEGEYEARIKLHPQVEAKIILNVIRSN